MTKNKQSIKLEASEYSTPNNPVAKNAFKFNKSHIFSDKTSYRRKVKHTKQGAFMRILSRNIVIQAPCFGFLPANSLIR